MNTTAPIAASAETVVNGNPQPHAPVGEVKPQVDPILLRRRAVAPASVASPEATSGQPSAENISARQRTSMHAQARLSQQAGTPPSTSPQTPPAPTEANPPAATATSSEDTSAAGTSAEPDATTTPAPAAAEATAGATTETSASTETETVGTESIPGEAELEAELSPDASAEEVMRGLIEEAKLDPDKAKLIKNFWKRMNQVTGQRDFFQKAFLAAAQGERPSANGNSAPAANGHTPPAAPAAPSGEVAKLEAQIQSVKNALAWANDNPDGGSVPLDGGQTRELNATEVAALRNQWSTQLVELTSKAAVQKELGTLRTQREIETNRDKVRQLYPWSTNQKSPEFQRAVQLYNAHPELHGRADHELIISRLVAAEFAERKLAPTGAPVNPLTRPMTKPKGSNTPAPVVTTTATAAPRIRPEDQAVAAAEAQFRKSGSARDKEKLLAARRAAQPIAA